MAENYKYNNEIIRKYEAENSQSALLGIYNAPSARDAFFRIAGNRAKRECNSPSKFLVARNIKCLG